MDSATRRENEYFENEVRRIARALWPGAEFQGAIMLDGREVDGVFLTEDCIHVVEATTSRRKEKAQQDVSKLDKTLNKLQRRDKTRASRGWFVTRDEPTAEQRKVAEKNHNIFSLSFSQFQAKLINSRAYLEARGNYPFGSVRDPATGKHPGQELAYIPLDMVRVDNKEIVSRNDLLSLMNQECTVVLLGDYGAGKSMTLREIYYALREKHLRNKTSAFPVYLNLRDHWGQTDTSEVIERHAKRIGFAQPSHLVRAWRAGYVHLLIDGFDEISTTNIQGMWRKLQESRFRAMQVVRCLIDEHPAGTGFLVAGRAHFFDNQTERHKALGLPKSGIELSLNEFTDEQITTYLRRTGLSGVVPPWLPSRPLLVGYLAAGGLLHDLSGGESPETGWDMLLDRVTKREAQIEAGIDGTTIRKILERLATKARSSRSGLTSLSSDSLTQAFLDVCGYKPDEGGMVLLQRLPGLGVDREEENSRTFIDEDFADACKAGDLVKFVENPFVFPSQVLTEMESSVGGLGIKIASRKVEERGLTEGQVNSALEQAQRHDAEQMTVDLVRLLQEVGFNLLHEVKIRGSWIRELELDAAGPDLSKLWFEDCFFDVLEIDPQVDVEKMPFFRECYISELEGRVSRRDLPKAKFDDECEIVKFSETAETTAEVLTLDLPLGTRVCLTILRKLYMQRGSGRKENALYRGLDDRARRLVSEVLRVLQSEGLAIPDRSRSNVIWRPDRSSRSRVGRMTNAPTAANDRVLATCGQLQT